MTIKLSTQDLAANSLTTHAFQPGVGYIDYGTMPLTIRGTYKGQESQCLPPYGTADGTSHIMSPDGNYEVKMTWIASQNAWAAPGGIRMAFTAKYLAAHGWQYIGPA